MAKIQFKAGDEYAVRLSRLGARGDEIAKGAIYKAAAIVADKIKSNIRALPADKMRYLREGEKFSGVTKTQRADLLNGFGVSPILRDRQGNHNAKIGFDGYGSKPTKKYPKGLPNQLLARSIESGSTVRKKIPFVRTAVNAVKKTALDVIRKVIDDETAKIMK